MKFGPLLAQFFYTHKRLDLPGLGSFLADPSGALDPENTREGKTLPPEAIRFENNPSVTASKELIQFISSKTGKILSLAAADLDSYLGQALQFLNIGKPFLLESIGSLVKTRSGEYVFSPGEIQPEKIKEFSVKDLSLLSSPEETFPDYKSVFYSRKEKAGWKRSFIAFLVMAGLGLAVWGGYTVYQMTSVKYKPTPGEEKIKAKTLTVNDSLPLQKDSAHEQAPAAPNFSSSPGIKKFILEVSGETRAFERFRRLKTFQWNVQMETKDSIQYKIFMVLPASFSDTSRLIDSLSQLNGRRVYIEE